MSQEVHHHGGATRAATPVRLIPPTYQGGSQILAGGRMEAAMPFLRPERATGEDVDATVGVRHELAVGGQRTDGAYTILLDFC